MLPMAVTLIPLYIIFRDLHWINTFLPLTVPAFFGGGAFNIFLLRQFFRGIPRELNEAALIDGANHWQIFWRVVLPLSRPALAVVAVTTAVTAWNDYLGPLIYLNTPDHFTLALGLSAFAGNAGLVSQPQAQLLMAATAMMVAPILVVFIFAQRYLIQGIVTTGLKG
jgi:multiple sugar transport system permease protein